MNKVACLFVGLGTEYINLILISILVLKAKIVDINRVITDILLATSKEKI